MAKFEQMITQDEYGACIKGCQTASRETKTTFTSRAETSKRRGAMLEWKVAKRLTLFIATYLGALVQAAVPSEIYVCAGNLSVEGRRDADGGYARHGLLRR